MLTSILREHPAMRGVLFDVDHVIAGAGPIIEAAGVADRCRTESGDFFKSVPAGGDAYIMKHIIHDWDDARATIILKNIRTALAGKPRGRVILIESVLQAGNAPDLGKLIDLEMLMMPGGRERTEDEFRSLFAGAGFELTRVVPTESPLAVVEAWPRGPLVTLLFRADSATGAHDDELQPRPFGIACAAPMPGLNECVCTRSVVHVLPSESAPSASCNVRWR